MKKQLRMPNIANRNGIEKDLVKLAYKLLSNGGTIEESIEDRSISIAISGEEFQLAITSIIPKTAVDILHYGHEGFSALVTDANGVRVQYHSDIDRNTAQCLGKLIDDVYDLNKSEQGKEAYVKFEAFLKD